MQISDLRVLIAGCGSIGKRHAQVLRGLGVQALSACDPSAESREGMRAVLPDAPLYADFTEALAREKSDAAFILTPTGLHVPMAMQAIEAGCHVLIEKPLANTPDGVDALKTLAQARGKQVMVAFCFRYHEALCKAKRLVEAGRIGRLCEPLMPKEEARRSDRTEPAVPRMPPGGCLRVDCSGEALAGPPGGASPSPS